MSTSSNSPAPSAVGNINVSADGENPPMTNVNHSPAPSAARNDNLIPNGKKPLRPFPMSSANHNDKGKEPVWGGPFNEAKEAGPSNINGSSLHPDLSNSIRTSPQRPYILNHNYNGDINGVFRNGKPLLPSTNVSSLGLPNGLRPYYGKGGYGHEMMTNSYQGLRGIAPHMQEQLRPFSVSSTSPLMYPVSFNGNYVPSFWPTFQGPINLSYVPFDMYRYPTHPQAQYFSGPSYVVPKQQSNFYSSFDDLRGRLRKQIEYYFSSENLPTDYYLKNLMDGHGWVSVTLIMKFRKVVALLNEKDIKMQSASIFDVLQVQDRSLSNDKQFVLDSVRPSDVVEVQGDRMRKRHEWEKWVLIPP